MITFFEIKNLIYKKFVNFAQFFILNILIVSEIIYVFYEREPKSIFLFFLFFIFLIFITQSTLLQFFNEKIKLPLAALIITFNIFILKLVNYSTFHSLVYIEIYLLFVLIFCITFIFFKKGYKFIFIFYFAVVASFFIPKLFLIDEKNDVIEDYNLPAFNQKPNIYLIGLDAIAPFSISNKLLETNFHYEKYIKDNILLFKNSYGAGYTWMTWPMILNLGQIDKSFILDSKNGIREFPQFLGKENSLLFSIFKNNGYRIITGFPTSMFGKPPIGKYIDDFYEGNKADYRLSKMSQACQDQSSYFNVPTLYGFCSKYSEKLFYKFINKINTPLGNPDFISRITHSISKFNTPTLFAFHLLYTGHTDGNFDYKNIEHFKEYKKKYSNGININLGYIKEIIELIKKKDQNAIVLFFGDHGLMFYRKEWKNPTWFENIDYFNDQYANQIFLVKTNNECATTELDYNENYSYQYTVLLGIIKCLSKDNKIDERLLNKTFLYKGLIFSNNEGIQFLNYSKYRYE